MKCHLALSARKQRSQVTRAFGEESRIQSNRKDAANVTPTFLAQVQTVIIGGGSLGCNIAYHLTKLGMTDVVVLGRDKLTSGTAWHATGEIVPVVLGSEWECELCTYGRNLIAGLET